MCVENQSLKKSETLEMPQLVLDMPKYSQARAYDQHHGAFEFYEFFAGAGMARAGLGEKWECLFANDFDRKKAKAYEGYWGVGTLLTADVASIDVSDLPGYAKLVWGSFPCQDLSLAGGGAGLQGERSGTFWPFWKLVKGLVSEGRGPEVIALENVCGALTSHDGKDFTAICTAMNDLGYSFGAVIVEASLFVPQSRPRLFIIGVRKDIAIPNRLKSAIPLAKWHSLPLRRAHNRLSEQLKEDWIWWSLPTPQKRIADLSSIIEEHPTSVNWHTPEQTQRLLSMMSDVNLAKVKAAQQAGRPVFGGIYKRTRFDAAGCKVQRAEVRFDDIAGCLRTPTGGSSRQEILKIDGETIKSRLISTRETARLMGLPDEYELPANYNEAYHLTGDGVVVPVVRFLASNIFEPIISRWDDALRECSAPYLTGVSA